METSLIKLEGILEKGMPTIVDAIEKGDVSFMKNMPGVGSKTASQIILDLKGKYLNNSLVI